MSHVRLDLNNPEFQADLFSLQKAEQLELLSALQRISRMTWEDIYRDRELRWEAIASRRGPGVERLYTFRVTKKFRALASREENWLRLLSLHADHDSAYRS